MHKYRILQLFLILLVSISGFSQSQLASSYIESYKHIAIQEMERTGIPASITLAQGLLESNWGRSELATDGNNHFGIKCSNEWKGDKYFHYDDEYNKLGVKKKSCFRVYESPEASFIDHSDFLVDPKKKKRYGFLFSLAIDDYESWARGLSKAGYATDPKYSGKLISIIEKYELQQFDKGTEEVILASIDESPNKKEAKFEYKTDYVNSCKYTSAKGGESVGYIAVKFGVSYRKLIKYNESLTKRSQQLLAGQRVFLEKKKQYYTGTELSHEVLKGQDISSISDLYGIDVDFLSFLNDIKKEKSLSKGETIVLRSSSGPSGKKRERSRSEDLAQEASIYIFEQALTPVKQ